MTECGRTRHIKAFLFQALVPPFIGGVLPWQSSFETVTWDWHFTEWWRGWPDLERALGQVSRPFPALRHEILACPKD